MFIQRKYNSSNTKIDAHYNKEMESCVMGSLIKLPDKEEDWVQKLLLDAYSQMSAMPVKRDSFLLLDPGIGK